MSNKNVLITGGCGFIGSNFVRYILKHYPEWHIINLDALTYAGNLENLKGIGRTDNYIFIKGDITDKALVGNLFEQYNIDMIVHFAAESHVDRSIVSSSAFITTNVIGTLTLLEAARKNWLPALGGLKDSPRASSARREGLGPPLFMHISTDEVYGSLNSPRRINQEGRFKEIDALKPNSPYSASKASADLLVRAYYKTYGLPAIIVRPSNTYGPYQYPEKFISLMITNILEDKPIPVYGWGKNIRTWLFVEDLCEAIALILCKGKTGEIYNVGGEAEQDNLYTARTILSLMGKDESYIKFVTDRPGHDFRYALDISKIKNELGWSPSVVFDEGIKRTVDWYTKNRWWWIPLKARLARESNGFWEDTNKP